MDPALQAILAKFLGGGGGGAPTPPMGGMGSMMGTREETGPGQLTIDPTTTPTPSTFNPGPPPTGPRPPTMGLGGQLTGMNPVITPMFQHLFSRAQVDHFGQRQPQQMVAPTFDGKNVNWNVGSRRWWEPNAQTTWSKTPGVDDDEKKRRE